MKLSNLFFNTLKESPKEAQIISHQLMLRASMIRQHTSGIYTWLPLGFRVLKNIEEIPLGIKTSLTGNFKITIDHLQGQLKESTVYIVDTLTNIEHNLKESDYTFYIDGSATEYNDRFVLRILTNIEVENLISDQLIVVKKGNELKIGTTNLELIATVKVYDIYGIEIASYAKKPKSKISLALKSFKSKSILIIKAVLVSGEVLTQKHYSE